MTVISGAVRCAAHDGIERAQRLERETQTKIRTGRSDAQDLKVSITESKAQLRSKTVEKTAYFKQVDIDVDKLRLEECVRVCPLALDVCLATGWSWTLIWPSASSAPTTTSASWRTLSPSWSRNGEGCSHPLMLSPPSACSRQLEAQRAELGRQRAFNLSLRLTVSCSCAALQGARRRGQAGQGASHGGRCEVAAGKAGRAAAKQRSAEPASRRAGSCRQGCFGGRFGSGACCRCAGSAVAEPHWPGQDQRADARAGLPLRQHFDHHRCVLCCLHAACTVLVCAGEVEQIGPLMEAITTQKLCMSCLNGA